MKLIRSRQPVRWTLALPLAALSLPTLQASPQDPPLLDPAKVVSLPEGWSGQYVVAGDLDGDGKVDFVTGRNEKQVMRTVIAVNLDGSVLWKWGCKDAGTFTRFYDVPLQIHDHDGDGAGDACQPFVSAWWPIALRAGC